MRVECAVLNCATTPQRVTDWGRELIQVEFYYVVRPPRKTMNRSRRGERQQVCYDHHKDFARSENWRREVESYVYRRVIER